jgi:hypothetical protein
MNREVHVRIWERPEVRVLWATRHEDQFPRPRLSAEFGFRKETIAGMRGNGRVAPIQAVRLSYGERVKATLSSPLPRAVL